MVELLEYEGNKITDEYIREKIMSLGIKKGDVLCVHSDIFSFGKPLVKKKEFLGTLCNIFKEIIGEEGTLIMPTFSYSFCREVDYDVKNSPSTVGALTEEFRREKNVCRTAHPIFSFAIWGRNKEEYCDIGLDAFGHDSVYGKMMQNEGKIMFFGANKGYTIYHLAEEHVGVPHRYFKNFSGNVIEEEGNTYFVDVPYYVRYLDKKSIAKEEIIERFLLDKKIQKQTICAGGTISVIDAKKSYEAFVEQLHKDKGYFVGE